MKLLCSLLMVFLISSCDAVDKDECNRFKTGKFTFKSEETGIRTSITRDENTQTEINGPDTLKASVKWRDDCTYDLTYLETSGIQPQLVGKTVNVRITKVSKDEYWFEARLPAAGLSDRGSIERVTTNEH